MHVQWFNHNQTDLRREIRSRENKAEAFCFCCCYSYRFLLLLFLQILTSSMPHSQLGLQHSYTAIHAERLQMQMKSHPLLTKYHHIFNHTFSKPYTNLCGKSLSMEMPCGDVTTVLDCWSFSPSGCSSVVFFFFWQVLLHLCFISGEEKGKSVWYPLCCWCSFSFQGGL